MNPIFINMNKKKKKVDFCDEQMLKTDEKIMDELHIKVVDNVDKVDNKNNVIEKIEDEFYIIPNECVDKVCEEIKERQYAEGRYETIKKMRIALENIERDVKIFHRKNRQKSGLYYKLKYYLFGIDY